MAAKSPPSSAPIARRRRRLGAPALFLLSLLAAAAAAAQVPATPGAVLEVKAIQPFRLETGYSYDWLAGRPEVSSGLLVVLKVDPRYVEPRDAAEPVLYAGNVTVQRLNQGDRSGYVVGIVPGKATLDSALVFFGSPELPERVTSEMAAAERERAAAAGLKPFTAEQIERARLEAVRLDDWAALLRGPAADLILKYSPDEKNLAEDWRQGAGPK